MDERARAQTVPTESLLSEDDMRRRLEGRVELLESALSRTRALEKALRRGDWREVLRGRLSLVSDLLDVEATLLEAMERTARRAELEGWSHDAPAVKLIQTLRSHRERLGQRVLARLEGLALRPARDAPLETHLRQLERLHREDVNLLRGPGEPFSIRIDGQDGPLSRIVTLLGVQGAFGLAMLLVWMLRMESLMLELLGLGFILSLIAAIIWASVTSPDAVWLTPVRLVWKRAGARTPLTVRLEDVVPESLALEEGRAVSLRAGNDLQVRLARFSRAQAERLMAVSTLFLEPMVRKRAARVSRPVEVSVFEGLLRRDGTWRPGKVVLMRRGAYFFEGTRAGMELLRAVTGRTLASRVELEWVLEGLLWQTEVDLDALLVAAVNALGGAVWSAEGTRVAMEVRLEQELHLTHGTEVIVGRVKAPERDVVTRILATWR